MVVVVVVVRLCGRSEVVDGFGAVVTLDVPLVLGRFVGAFVGFGDDAACVALRDGLNVVTGT